MLGIQGLAERVYGPRHLVRGLLHLLDPDYTWLNERLARHYGIDDVCLSLPCVVGAQGIEEVLTLHISPEEEQGLQESARTLKSTYASLTQQKEP